MKVKSVLVLASLLLVIILNSCEDSTVNVNGSTVVSGTVRGLLNFPLDNVKITIKDKSVFTTADGKFSLTDVSLPCDVYVKDSARKYEIIYKNVTTSSLIMNLPVRINQDLLVGYNLNVHYPALSSGEEGRLFFMDDEKDICGAQTLPIGQISFQAPPNLILNGKVFFISYKMDGYGHLNDYKYFAMKSDVTIVSGTTAEITFTQADMKPVEKDSVSFIINPPSGSSFANTFFIINFFNRRTSYYLNYLSIGTYNENNFSLFMPNNLPVEFTPAFYFVPYIAEGGSVNQLCVIPKTGTNVQVNVSSVPSILTPENNATNVDLNTVFSFQKQPISNILVYSLMDTLSGISYNLCTSENSITLSMLSPMLTNLVPNTKYTYTIEQVGVNSINVGEYLRDGRAISFIRGISQGRYFTSKP